MKPIALLGAAVVALSFGVAAASAPAPAPSYRTQLWDSDDSVDLAVADFNGDGRNDIATANYNPSSVTVGNKEYDVGAPAYWLEAHDLNGDGRPDLVVESQGDTVFVSVLLNQGGGAFRPATKVLDDAGRITVGDVTGDGRPDIVSVVGNEVTVVPNHGDGTFAAPTTYAAGKSASQAAIADVNGDGKADLVLASPGGTLAVLLNNGDGTFQPRADYATGPKPATPAVGDLNGDGKADVVVPSAGGTKIGVFLANGDGSLGARRDDAAGATTNWVDIRDVNGDGKPDVLAHGTDTKTLAVLLGNGDGTFKPARTYRTWGYSWVEAVRDVNGDGSPDVVMLAGDVQVVSVLVNRGDGTFEPKLDYIPALELWSPNIAVGDVAGDKRPELIVPVGSSRNGDTYLSVFVNRPGTCNVQLVGGMTVAAAKQQLARLSCRLGTVTRVFSNWVAQGRVLSQKPRFGSQVTAGTRVNLVVSKGRWR